MNFPNIFPNDTAEDSLHRVAVKGMIWRYCIHQGELICGREDHKIHLQPWSENTINQDIIIQILKKYEVPF